MDTPRCLCIDLEISHEAELDIHKIGAWRADSGQSALFQGAFSLTTARARLDELTQGAAFLLGHNTTEHDLPVLRKVYPSLALHVLPVIDTLWLSPLAFPQNPYHSLVKDYKLIRDSRSDPLRDAQLSFQLFSDQFEAFTQRLVDGPAELACFHFLLAEIPGTDHPACPQARVT